LNSGPFVNFSVNLGPVAPTSPFVSVVPGYGFAYNPRCIRRDISQYVSSHSTNESQVYNLIVGNDDIYGFQMVMEGQYQLFSQGILGVHTGGHFTIGGDPGGVSCFLAGGLDALTELTGPLRFSWGPSILFAPCDD
jgi:tyrosinase